MNFRKACSYLLCVFAFSFCFSVTCYGEKVVETKDGRSISLSNPQETAFEAYKKEGLSEEEAAKKAINTVSNAGYDRPEKNKEEEEEEEEEENKEKKKKGENGEPDEDPRERPQAKDDTNQTPAAAGKEKTSKEIAKERKACDDANEAKLAKAEALGQTEEAQHIRDTIESNHAAWKLDDAQTAYTNAQKQFDQASSPKKIEAAKAKLEAAQDKLWAAQDNYVDKGWGGTEAVTKTRETDAANYDKLAADADTQANNPSLDAKTRMDAANAAGNYRKMVDENREILEANKKAWEEEKNIRDTERNLSEAKVSGNKENIATAQKALDDAKQARNAAVSGSGEWGDPNYGRMSAERENKREEAVAQRSADYYKTRSEISGDSADRAKAASARDEVRNRQGILTADKLAWEKEAAAKTIQDMSSGIVPRDDGKLAEARATLKSAEYGEGQWQDQWGASRNDKTITPNDPAWTPGGDAYARKRTEEELNRQKQLASTPEEASEIDNRIEANKNTWKTEDAKYDWNKAKNNLDSLSKEPYAAKSDIDAAKASLTSAQEAFDAAKSEPNQWPDKTLSTTSVSQTPDFTKGNADADLARFKQAQAKKNLDEQKRIMSQLNAKRNNPKATWTSADDTNYANAKEYVEDTYPRTMAETQQTIDNAQNNELYRRGIESWWGSVKKQKENNEKALNKLKELDKNWLKSWLPWNWGSSK